MSNSPVEAHSSRHSLSASIGPVVQVVCTFSIPLRASHLPLLGLSVTNPAELLEMMKAERATREMQMFFIVVMSKTAPPWLCKARDDTELTNR